MLTELSIKNFAIIDKLSISWKEGLTIITGETGAGKSIIIDALGLLVGGRGSSEFVRHGEKRAELEGLFIIENPEHPVYKKALDLGFDIDEDNMVVLHRAISASGKSVCRINGKLTTLAILKEIGQTLLDIHSQYETQSLLHQDKHINLLDQFVEAENPGFMDNFHSLYNQWKELKTAYKNFSQNEKELAQRLDLLQFQLNEIQEANLQPNEDKDLISERNNLRNFEVIFQNLTESYNALRGEQRAMDWLSHASNYLEIAGEYQEDIKTIHQKYIDHYYMLEELSFNIRDYLDQLEFDQERLDIVEARLDEINQLKRKYGNSVDEIMEFSAKVEEEMETITNQDQHLSNLAEQLEEIADDLLIEAEDIHKKRLKAASQLEKAVQDELKDLYLDKAVFNVNIHLQESLDGLEYRGKNVHLNELGMDRVEFFISTNPGEPPKELRKIASGGEMSRIMLALKNIFAKHQRITSVIFDEVDTGVSGRVAQSMAEKIYNISNGSQVICISHLPQVASMADTHLKIEKILENNRTYTTVSELAFEDRIEEIGKMMTGAELTETSKIHARELIERNMSSSHS
ncbi:DNA repair protein RecN (Recombination protein N) [Gracilibacillus halotolerans]|uniref:DNA repair protein RecN n=1 Tax=Gracilibacillus halotolerans TaxID=74386 RepID=A0A841RJC0_9BACI|nr:DNA repair protein RecN [Gracilibacillus halotolerans]MBB6511743.1 DNA repair protein RecN (Recombination protein N) [Gracilibacillus halotolerans]